MENLKIEDLIEGEIYRYDYTNKYAIGICKNSGTIMTLNVVYSDNQYYRSNTISQYKFKKATEKEKHWLNCCIAKNQFIPYTEAVKTFNQQNTQQYVVGKWYYHPKWCKNTHIKFHSIRDNNSVNRTEIINRGIFKKEINWSVSYEHTLLQSDLQEIQEYLPESHPDKIPTNMFKKDDYIVVLQKPNGCLDYLPPNFCFKQYQNYETLFAEKAIDKTVTSCSDVTFLNKFTWRYATKEEISEYNRIGKPFDVTTLVKQELKQSKYNFKGVHCKTQEEWDFVISKYNPKNLESNSFNAYNSDSFIIIEILSKSKDNTWLGCYGNVNDKDTEYYSFEEWCNKFGHIPDFKNKIEEIPEYVKWISVLGSGGKGKMCDVLDFKLNWVFCTKTDDLPSCGLHGDKKNWKIALTNQFYSYNFIPSTKEAYEAQFLLGNNWIKNAEIVHQSYPVTPEECFNNETIEIGDKVEVILPCQSSYNKKNTIGKVQNIKEILLIGFGDCKGYQINGWWEHISGLKLIKKVNNTTTHVNKKVDISSPIQVGNEITNITIPKSASVVLKNTENEVKIKINLKQTIKL